MMQLTHKLIMGSGFVEPYGAHRSVTDPLLTASKMAKLATETEVGTWDHYLADITIFLHRAFAQQMKPR